MVAPRWLDPGNLFAVLYDNLTAAEPSRLDLDDWFHDPDSEATVLALERRIIEEGCVETASVREMAESLTGAFQLLLAIDRACREIDPLKDVGLTALEPLRQRWRDTGRLNTEATSGSVIFRRGYPARPQGVIDDLDGHLRGLKRVADTSARHFLIPALNDIDPISRLDGDLVFGCLSFVNDLGDFEITRIDRGSGWYSIKIADDDPAPWEKKIALALAALDDSRCHVAVLPELVLTDTLLNVWTHTIRDAPAPPHSRLAWILAGTGPVSGGGTQPPNRAVVVNRHTGAIVFEQDKRHPFTLSDRHIEKWRLAPALGPGPLGEWMAEGRTNIVAESAVGRFTICICEDLGRVHEAISVVAAWGVSHVLVPIFSEPIRPHYWEHNSAERIVNQVGSGVIVANSQAITITDPLPEATTVLFARVNADERGGPAPDWAVECHHPLIHLDPLKVHTWDIPCA